MSDGVIWLFATVVCIVFIIGLLNIDPPVKKDDCPRGSTCTADYQLKHGQTLEQIGVSP